MTMRDWKWRQKNIADLEGNRPCIKGIVYIFKIFQICAERNRVYEKAPLRVVLTVAHCFLGAAHLAP